MKKYSLLLVLIALLIGISTHKTFADNIGYIDMQKILTDYTDAQKAQQDFKAKQDAYQKEVEKRQEELEKAKNDKKSDAEIKKLIDKYQDELEPKKNELIKLNQELMVTLKTKITKASEEVAKKYGIDVVVDKQAILTGGFDLTDYVLKKLNK